MDKSAEIGGWDRAIASRRRALALMVGAGGWWARATGAADEGGPLRLAISESLVADVNLNDARAAMLIWIKKMTADMNLAVEVKPKVFDPTEEILRRARTDQFDTVALNVIEYRQIASLLDASQIVAEGGKSGPEQYILLVKRGGGIQQLGDLRGRRLLSLKSPKMCVGPAWLTTILDEAHLGASEQFFSSMTSDSKASRVVLPVFFGQSDACLTSRRSFETMSELNPQVARDLVAIARSPTMVVTFYMFHKNYRGVSRERFVKAYADLPNSVAGRQLATLFQFESLVFRDISSLAPALAILDAAERVQARRGSGGRKG